MKTKRQRSRVLRQVLLLMAAQSLAIASMIWGGSLTVDAPESALRVERQLASAQTCQGTVDSQCSQPRAVARNKKPATVRLLDFSIGKPWG